MPERGIEELIYTLTLNHVVYLFLLGAVRSVLWMYLILRQRAPARVTHGLFVMEIVCLLVLVFEELSALEKNTGSGKCAWLYGGLAILFLGGAGAVTADSWAGFPGEYRDTVAFHEGWQELLQYCSWRKDCFYLFDVYSTVNYSEPIFGDAREGPDNYDICGGWLAKRVDLLGRGARVSVTINQLFEREGDGRP